MFGRWENEKENVGKQENFLRKTLENLELRIILERTSRERISRERKNLFLRCEENGKGWMLIYKLNLMTLVKMLMVVLTHVYLSKRL